MKSRSKNGFSESVCNLELRSYMTNKDLCVFHFITYEMKIQFEVLCSWVHYWMIGVGTTTWSSRNRDCIHEISIIVDARLRYSASVELQETTFCFLDDQECCCRNNTSVVRAFGPDCFLYSTPVPEQRHIGGEAEKGGFWPRVSTEAIGSTFLPRFSDDPKP